MLLATPTGRVYAIVYLCFCFFSAQYISKTDAARITKLDLWKFSHVESWKSIYFWFIRSRSRGTKKQVCAGLGWDGSSPSTFYL